MEPLDLDQFDERWEYQHRDSAYSIKYRNNAMLELFREPEYQPFAADRRNLQTVLSQLETWRVPPSARNLLIALRYCRDEGLLNTENPLKKLFAEWRASSKSWAHYASRDSAEKIAAALNSQDQPLSVELIESVFQTLVRERKIRAVDVGLTRIPVQTHTEVQAARTTKQKEVADTLGSDSLRVDHATQNRSASHRGLSTDLQQAYQKSLHANKADTDENRSYARRATAARIAVAEEHPELTDRNSPEFKRLVSEKLAQ